MHVWLVVSQLPAELTKRKIRRGRKANQTNNNSNHVHVANVCDEVLDYNNDDVDNHNNHNDDGECNFENIAIKLVHNRVEQTSAMLK